MRKKAKTTAEATDSRYEAKELLQSEMYRLMGGTAACMILCTSGCTVLCTMCSVCTTCVSSEKAGLF